MNTRYIVIAIKSIEEFDKIYDQSVGGKVSLTATSPIRGHKIIIIGGSLVITDLNRKLDSQGEYMVGVDIVSEFGKEFIKMLKLGEI